MRADMAAIPFQNLDVLLGRGVRVDLESVADKLVTGRRGGYCFEHGTLFQAALRALGVEATAHAARVLLVAPKAEAPGTHMFLTIVDGGTTWCSFPASAARDRSCRCRSSRGRRLTTTTTSTGSFAATGNGCSKDRLKAR